jgi:hypothetical protein
LKNGDNLTDNLCKLLGDKERQEKLLEKSNKFKNLETNLGAQNLLDPSEIVHEIRDAQDNSYFNILKGDDQEYSDFHNRDSDEESKKEASEDNFVVRRSRRKTNRMSFADLNENGHIDIDHHEAGDEFCLIKCKPYSDTTCPQPLIVYLSFQSFLQMSIYAHLFAYEIIGFIAGHSYKNKDGKRAIFVEEAYPVEPMEDLGVDRTKTVEMDPESSSLVKNIANGRGQKI